MSKKSPELHFAIDLYERRYAGKEVPMETIVEEVIQQWSKMSDAEKEPFIAASNAEALALEQQREYEKCYQGEFKPAKSLFFLDLLNSESKDPVSMGEFQRRYATLNEAWKTANKKRKREYMDKADTLAMPKVQRQVRQKVTKALKAHLKPAEDSTDQEMAE